ncbi:hypothetical protein BOW53_09005 [Solemya pervernicosa gill symbiont]|uniref:Small-conductance mechanosensitive channel n=1 Tax=Solemya pervernicosa gill symbiont TaxID=642797 RepID=A0A1T2L4R2_9GAMM|nr:mechanosensitive ion channel family protein [Solemya pervernicosa gill symbiont]OOZ40083.1 hypothetical protein BOW53_09005 [Solemya pervernicosa gill symbiont]
MQISLWTSLVDAVAAIHLGYQLAAIVIISLLLIRTAAITHRQILHILGFYLLGLIGYLITILLLNSGVIDEGTIPQHIAILVMGLAAIRLAGLILFHRLLPLIQIHAPTILQDILVTIAYLLWCMVRLSEIGLDFSSIVTTSAVITAVLAFSLQDTLGNILGGTALQLDDSIHIGDWVKVDDAVGRVVDICWRSTSIETRNWETVVIPNSILMKGKFTILGRRQGEPIQLRRWIRFSVEFSVPPAQVIHTVDTAIHQADIANVASQPLPNCVAMGIDGSTINYALRYWLTDLAVDDPTDSAVRTHIYAALKRASIEFALPQQSLHLYKESRKVRAKAHSRDIKHRIELLERVALFANLDQEERRVIAEQLTYAPFVEGDVITQQGTVANWLYILIEGQAEVVLSSEGEQRQVNIINGGEAGSFFGEMGLLTGAPRAANVIALTDVECYRLDKEAFEQVIKARPVIAEEISRTMAKRDADLSMAKNDLDRETRDRLAAAQHDELLVKIRHFFGL